MGCLQSAEHVATKATEEIEVETDVARERFERTLAEYEQLRAEVTAKLDEATRQYTARVKATGRTPTPGEVKAWIARWLKGSDRTAYAMKYSMEKMRVKMGVLELQRKAIAHNENISVQLQQGATTVEAKRVAKIGVKAMKEMARKVGDPDKMDDEMEEVADAKDKLTEFMSVLTPPTDAYDEEELLNELMGPLHLDSDSVRDTFVAPDFSHLALPVPTTSPSAPMRETDPMLAYVA